MLPIDRVVIDGRLAGASDLSAAVTARYGHFTAMQVRDRRVRALDLHLARLRDATRELFGIELDTGLVLDSIRTALGDDVRDASVRVYVTQADPVMVLAAVRPPTETPAGPYRLRSVVYQRFLPHVKHLGGFPQAYLGQTASADGFDEVLFTLPDGTVCEGAVTNVGCFDGERVVWPDGPQLAGTGMLLMRRAPGVEHVTRTVNVADLPGFAAVFVVNSWGVVPVSSVDGVELACDKDAMGMLIRSHDDTAWDPI
ncbi:aminotransferase class IV [Nonomuraea sp. NPDC050556]|uniref:aminotransferase class IV n=1 Tax=Nonomuraea sp. NPDC050556 TaxID=3364369 RepID=UPI0037B24ECD